MRIVRMSKKRPGSQAPRLPDLAGSISILLGTYPSCLPAPQAGLPHCVRTPCISAETQSSRASGVAEMTCKEAALRQDERRRNYLYLLPSGTILLKRVFTA